MCGQNKKYHGKLWVDKTATFATFMFLSRFILVSKSIIMKDEAKIQVLAQPINMGYNCTV